MLRIRGNKSRKVKSSITVSASVYSQIFLSVLGVFCERDSDDGERYTREGGDWPPAVSTFMTMTSSVTQNCKTDTVMKCRRTQHLFICVLGYSESEIRY